MDSEDFQEKSLTDNSELEVNKSVDEGLYENDIPIEKPLTENINENKSNELSLDQENIINSESNVNKISEENCSTGNEINEENVEGVNNSTEVLADTAAKQVDDSEKDNAVQPMVIDEVKEDKTETSVNSLGSKLPGVEEGEEDFSGFSSKSDDTQDFTVIKGIFQQEEVEITKLSTMGDRPVTESRPLSALNKRKIEESDMSSQCSSPALSISSVQSAASLSKRSRTESPASRGSRKSTVDLSNPKYLVPFEQGWRREVVTRAVTSKEDGISKDVYYFHPTGKKLRSLREVSEKLTPGLTIDNFTFYKEAIGADPQFETVRNARGHGQVSPSEFGTPKTPAPAAIRTKAGSVTPVDMDRTKSTPPVKSAVRPQRDNARIQKQEKLVLKFNKGTPKIALKKTPAVNGESRSPKALASRAEGLKINPSAPLGPRRIITKRKAPLKPQNSDDANSVNRTEGSGNDVDMPPVWSPNDGSTISSSNESLSWSHLDEEKTVSEENRLEPCSIRCMKAMGLIPTLQCSVCLCLYHPECCDLGSTASYRPLAQFVCKNCQSKATDTKSQHLLKHITPALVTCDRNTPIISPKPIHPGLSTSPTSQNNPTAVRVPQPVRPKPNISKPGNMNTWLPPSNTVFRAPSASKVQKPEDSVPPQAIVSINNKRYIVVPKNNLLSAGSNQNQPNKSEPAQNTTIITPTPNSTIIQGPPLYNNPFIKPSNNSSGVTLVPYIPNDTVTPAPQQYHVVNPLPASSTNQPDLPVGSNTTDHFPKEIDKTVKRPSVDGNDDSMQKFMRNICIGYSALLNVFQYLKVQELLRAGRVCKLWRDLANHPSLWKTVRMKNSQVTDFEGFSDALIRHGTKHLDLRKMLIAIEETEEMWRTFAKHIADVKSLERIDMCKCSVNAIEQTLQACPQLVAFSAQMVGVKESMQQKLSLECFSKMNKLTELRMKSNHGLYLDGSFKSLTSVADSLTMLSLTTVKDLGCCQVEEIGNLVNLENLELGECSDLPENFPQEVIAKLVKLKRIRIEKGPIKCSINQMLVEMSKLPELEQLELINFDVKPLFDEVLALCTNVKRLLLIPTYVTQSATTNNIILSGVYKLWKTLTHFIWVVTLELLKVTELFVDQCEGPGSKKSGGNCIPVLKPVPKSEVAAREPNSDVGNKDEEDAINMKNGITVIPLNELNDLLTKALPETKVKLLKMPFVSTWRQCISFTDT